jgi:vanillate/4-hydroxybenzoate decarboxylase subunit D
MQPDTIICPRCRTAASTLSTSPVPGRWTVYGCPVCLFSWRSTEPPTVTDPDRYPSNFRIDAQAVPTFTAVPAVPARRAER